MYLFTQKTRSVSFIERVCGEKFKKREKQAQRPWSRQGIKWPVCPEHNAGKMWGGGQGVGNKMKWENRQRSPGEDLRSGGEF